MEKILDISVIFKFPLLFLKLHMNFECYLFDFDNCLLEIPNTFKFFNQVLLKTLERLKVNPIPSKQEREKFWFSGNHYLSLLSSWGIQDEDIFWERFDKTDFNKRKELLDQRKLHLYNDVIPVLEKLRKENKKLGIISNTAEYVVNFILEELNLDHYFQDIFGMGKKTQNKAKPSPDGVLEVLNNLGCSSNKEGVLMVGDSSADIEAAKMAKIKSCLIIRDSNKFQDGHSNWKYQPDYIITNLGEILDL
jgi:HAD superfamily hydrolase (TIGR01549 family)